VRFDIIFTVILVLLIPTSRAFTTATVRNFVSFTDGFPILGAVGEPINGSYAVGIYENDFDFSQSATEVRDGLTPFGEELNDFVFTGLIGAPNSTNGSIPFENESRFADQNIFVLFGNASSLADSNLFGVFRLNTKFQEENELGAGVALADVLPGNGDLLYGRIIRPDSQPVGNPDFDFAQGIQLVAVAIPEPSTGLLTVVAGLALVARRRR